MFGKIKKLCAYLAAMPKSMWVNLRVFGIKGLFKMPILVSAGTKISGLHRGCVQCEVMRFGAFRIGFSLGSNNRGRGMYTRLSFGAKGTLHIKDVAYMAKGTVLNIRGGDVYLGRNFNSNYGLLIICEREIRIGDECAIGWNVSIMDTDGHLIVDEAGNRNDPRPIYVGNHVWLCAEVTVMKGAYAADGCVIPWGTVYTAKHETPGCIIGGSPNHVLKEHITWEK